MPPIAPLSGNALAGPIGGVISEILGDIGANASRRAAVQPGGVSGGTAGRTENPLGGLHAAFSGLFDSSTQPSSIAQAPSLFSGSTASPQEALGSLQQMLADISQKLSAILNASSAPGQAPSPASAAPVSTAAASAAPASAAPASAASPFPDLGPEPFMSAPTGTGPSGSYGFNPVYFPTQATAQKIAQMLGGTVVAQDALLNAPGSPFKQNQPNFMVQLPNGNVINPGYIAQAIAVGQPRNMIDALIYSTVNDTGYVVGQAPQWTPTTYTTQNTTAPPAPSATAPSQTAPASNWSNINQMVSDARQSLRADGGQPDAAALAAKKKMELVMDMLQLLARLLSIQKTLQPSAQNIQSA
ncbi:MAG: hypothetical protein NTW28_14700 [Candidatus Solibacter sp.]|nr:hypothetical protein [Candidatus Solibacter sp.]